MCPYSKPPAVTEKTGRGDPVPEGVEDPIAEALLSGSAYERLRVTRLSYFGQPVPRRLAWQGAVLGALALVAPLWITAPPEIRAAAGATASPTVLLVGVFAVGVQLLGAAGHAATTLVRLRADDMGERAAGHLLAAEEVSSLLGLGTGGFATAATLGYFLLGRLGPETVSSYVAAGGANPFAPSGLGVSVTAVAAAALVAAGGCLVASYLLDAALDGA